VKRLAFLTGIFGLLLLIGLVVRQGLPDLLLAFERAGWPLLLLVPMHCVPLLLDAQGWKVLLAPIDPLRRASLWFLFRIACVREAVGRLLPVVGIGGEVVGIRLTLLRLDDSTGVTATVIVEVLLTIVTQYLFCGLGIVMLTSTASDLAPVWSISTAILLSLPIPLIVYLLLRHGAVFERLGEIAKKLFGADNRFAIGLDGARLDAEVHALFAQPLRLLHALAWQFSAYLIGSFETWFALQLLGHRVSLGTALAIEALIQATRHAAFFIPGGLGVQEAGVMLFGYMAGINGETALSLALVKRMREILFGVPALLAWQWQEARQIGRSRMSC
jgi:putative membrane protein